MIANNLLSEKEANNALTFVREKLKRKDRIVWWLKWYRLTETHHPISKLLKEPKFQHRADEFKKLFQKITKTNYDSVIEGELDVFRSEFMNKFSMQHKEFQLTIPAIDQIVWDINATPQYMNNLMVKLESDYNEEQQKKKQIVTPKPGDKVVIDYGKYAWVMLDRGACSDEADAMGHCGNEPSELPGDRILSFRSKVDGGKQKPHLTFILHDGGFLGEMKGRANEKPNSKYHPYIIDLLKQDFVKGIEGGGFQPEKNFKLKDLPAEQSSELIKLKPELGGIESIYSYKGFIEPVKRAVDQVLENNSMSYIEISDEQVYIQEFDKPGDIFWEFNLKNIAEYEYAINRQEKIKSGDYNAKEGFYDTYIEGSGFEEELLVDEQSWQEILNNLPTDTVSKLAEYLNTDSDISYEDFMADEMLSGRYAYAVREGVIAGTFSKIMESFDNWLDENSRTITTVAKDNGTVKYFYYMELSDLVYNYDYMMRQSRVNWSDITKSVEDISRYDDVFVFDSTAAATELNSYLAFITDN
jgi:hypothetical protein